MFALPHSKKIFAPGNLLQGKSPERKHCSFSPDSFVSRRRFIPTYGIETHLKGETLCQQQQYEINVVNGQQKRKSRVREKKFNNRSS
jgi:hypothetical protein